MTIPSSGGPGSAPVFLRTNASVSQPDEPAVSRCAPKSPVSRPPTRSIAATSRARPLPSSADATATSAEKPVLDAAGSVMANVNSPRLAASAMSDHVTGDRSQPNRRATTLRNPSTTGEPMIRTESPSRVLASGSISM